MAAPGNCESSFSRTILFRVRNGAGLVLRGGSWNNNPRNVRVSNRNRNEPDNRNNNIGFRCSREVGRRLIGLAAEAGADAISVASGAPLRTSGP